MQRTTRTLLAAALTLGAALGASPAVAAPATAADTLRTICESGDGTFHTAFGYHRCFGAELDGRDQFTAAEHVCGGIVGSDFRWATTPHYGPDRGSWICGIS